jgi:HEAT repeat protein
MTDLNTLTRELTSDDPVRRREAALQLGEATSASACEALIGALGDPQLSVQEAVILSLVKQPYPDKISLLVNVLQENNPVRRNAALNALLEISAETPALTLAALRHASIDVRQWAAEMLGEISEASSVTALLERLEDADEFPNVRRAAAQSLGRLGNTAATPALMKAAAHGDFWMRQAAIEALSRLGDEQVVEPLLSLMKQDAWTRPAVIKALGNIGSTAAISDLVTALDDQSATVRTASLEAMFRIVMEPSGRRTGTPRTAMLRPVIPVGPLRRELNARTLPNSAYAAHLLGWLGDRTALPDLLECLDVTEEALRDAAIESLLRFGSAAVPVLVAAVTRPEPALRERIIELLGMVGDQSVVPVLTELLADRQITVRQAVLRALGALGGEAAYTGLLQALNDPATRDTALGILSQFNDPALVGELKTHLQRYLYESKSPAGLRWAAAQALSLLGDEAAVSILLNATRLPDELIRKPAAEALARVRGRRAVNVLIEALGDRDWLVRQKAIEALSSIQDSRVVAALIPLARDPEWRVRWSLVAALGRMRDSRVYGPLAELARDADRWVRHRAMEVCGRMEDSRAVEIALRGLKDAEPAVRIAALDALLPQREPALIGPIAELAQDADAEVRATAARTLAFVAGANAIDSLTVLAHDPMDNVRATIGYVLGELGSEEGIPALETLLRDSAPAVRAHAADALAHIGTTLALQSLVEALTHPTVKPEAQARLLAVGEPALRVLVSATRSPKTELRIAAAETLGRTGNAQVASALQVMLRDADQRVKAAAEEAITTLTGK